MCLRSIQLRTHKLCFLRLIQLTSTCYLRNQLRTYHARAQCLELHHLLVATCHSRDCAARNRVVARFALLCPVDARKRRGDQCASGHCRRDAAIFLQGCTEVLWFVHVDGKCMYGRLLFLTPCRRDMRKAMSHVFLILTQAMIS